MYTVSDVLRPQVTRSWYEAVAIVQEVTSQLAPGASVPGPNDLVFDSQGRLHLGFGSDTEQNPVVALASLLGLLLEGIDAPAGLRELARNNTGSSPVITSVDGFQRGLAFYERPGRGNDLQTLVNRLQSTPTPPEPEVDPAREFEHLREKLAGRDVPQSRADSAPAAKRVRRRTIVIAALVELAVLGAIVVYARPQYFRGAGLTDAVEQRLADSISSGLDRMGGAPKGATDRGNAALAEAPSSPAPSSAAPSSAVQRPPAPAAKGGSSTPRTPAEKPIPSQTQLSASVAPSDPLPRIELAIPPASPTVSSDPPVRGLRIDPNGVTFPEALDSYSRADVDVDPPRLSRPQLPRQPAPNERTGYFDLLIDERGIVEQVRLISPSGQYREVMLLAAAKAWQFSPARKDGLPVRYRMRVAIILPGLQ
jgi:hypothetical protein